MSASLSLPRAAGSMTSRATGNRSKSVPSTTSLNRARCVIVRAEDNDSLKTLKPPAGVTLPPKQPSVPPAMFGFVDWAEKMNSRAAMIGFFALLALEGVTQKPFLELIGWTIGNGLNELVLNLVKLDGIWTWRGSTVLVVPILTF